LMMALIILFFYFDPLFSELFSAGTLFFFFPSHPRFSFEKDPKFRSSPHDYHTLAFFCTSGHVIPCLSPRRCCLFFLPRFSSLLKRFFLKGRLLVRGVGTGFPRHSLGCPGLHPWRFEESSCRPFRPEKPIPNYPMYALFWPSLFPPSFV